MADLATPQVPPQGPSQEDLVLKQFAAAKKNLTQQQMAQQDQAAMDVNRRVAQGGMTGGAQTKVLENSQRGIANQYATGQAGLDTAQAQALQGIQATKEAQQFQTGERLGTQQFAAEQTKQAQNIQQEQFNKTYGLQQQQFSEAQRQFDKQMAFTYDEFNENQKTNLLNSSIALYESGLDTPQQLQSVHNLFAGMGMPYTFNQSIGKNRGQ